MAQGAPTDPGQRAQPLRSHSPALQWPSQGCRSAPQPAYRYARLPVLVVADWSDVTPALLRAFWANYTLRREAYDYERLFADHWFARIGAQRARCLAHHQAHTRPLTASGSGGGGGGGGGSGGGSGGGTCTCTCCSCCCTQ